MQRQHIRGREFLLLAAVLAAMGAIFAYLGIERMFREWDWLNDLHFFYQGAELVTGEHRDILYDPAARVEAGLGFREGEEVFPYPAPMAYLFWPLTLTDIVTARYIFMGVVIAGTVALALGGYLWSRDWRFAVLLLLLAASSFTYYETLRFSQLSPLLAGMLCLAMLSAASPKSLSGGFFNGLLVLKPSIAAAPLLLLTLRRGYRQVAAAAFIAILIFILLPLLTVGFDGLRDYVELLLRYQDESFKLDGEFTAGAGWMLGWQAIVGRLAEGDPSPAVVLPLNIVTLLLAGRVWLHGDWFHSWLAFTLAVLLVVTHAVWYDWLILIGVAPFVAYRDRSLALTALLLALHAAISFDSYMIVSRPIFDAYPVPTPLIALAILCYLAFHPFGADPGPADEPRRGIANEK